MRKNYNILENQHLIGGGVDPVLYNTYFYVEDISGEDGNECIIKKSDIEAPDVYLEYSYDQINWITLPVTSVDGYSIYIPVNKKMYLRGENRSFDIYSYAFERPRRCYNTITCTHNYNIGGNIMSLFNGKTFINNNEFPDRYSSTISRLFLYSVTLINTENLILPATLLPSAAYAYTFYGCTNLLTSPKELPSFKNYSECYAGMFYNCENLRTSPIIKLNDIYQHELYGNDFTSMFQNTSINYLKVYFMSYDNTKGQFSGWLSRVSPTGTFLLPVGSTFADDAPRDGNGIPSGWEIKYFNPETDEIVE